MTRKQRFHTCNRLIRLVEIARTQRTSKIYQQQLERCASRLKEA